MNQHQKIQLIAVVCTGAFAAVVLELVRRRRLSERLSLAWLAIAALIGVFAFFRPLQFFLADLIGLFYPPILVLASLLFALLAVSLYYSVALTRLGQQNRRLAQRLSLLESAHREGRQGRNEGPAGPRPVLDKGAGERLD